MSKVKLQNLNKVYPNGFHAVKDLNLNINDQEFLVLVGPSGCGKSTTLRMIAGLEDVSNGTIKINNRIVNELDPKDRDIAMVFQNYALYPHMTAYENIEFGMKIRGVKKDERKKRVLEASKLLGIEELLNNKPKSLSGGQRQRVALGRAIVRDSNVFLMDEPLSNLDAKLRVQMRTEILKVHKRLKATTIYVTHDQTEAMTMGDKIVIMDKGIIQQWDDPHEIYKNPKNLFVASFIGIPEINLLEVSFSINGDSILIIFNKFNICKLPINFFNMNEMKNILNGQNLVLGVRPEEITLVDINKKDCDSIPAIVETVEINGSESIIFFKLNNKRFCARINGMSKLKMGDRINIGFKLNSFNLFDYSKENLNYKYKLQSDKCF